MKTWWTMPELLGHPPGVLDVGHRAAARVGRAAPQLEGRPHHLVRRAARPGGRRRPTSRPLRTWPPGTRTAQSRSRSTGPGTTASTRSMSAAVVCRPQREADRRCGASAAQPHGGRTWLGSSAPLEQAAPAETRTPASSSRTTSASLSTPAKRTWEIAGHLDAAVPGRRPAVSAAPDRRRTRPSTSRSAEAAHPSGGLLPALPRWRPGRRPWPRCRPRCACRSAAPAPAHRRGSPAPSRVPSRTTRAPTPFGPPNLWALTDTQVGHGGHRGHVEPRHRPGRRRCAATRPGATPAHQGGHLRQRLHGADLVVDGHHRHQPDLRAARRASAVEVDRPRVSVRRATVGGRRSARAAWPGRRGAPWPSTPPRPAPPAAWAPRTARLSASVRPVNTTSPGSAPRTGRRLAGVVDGQPGPPGRRGRPTGCRSARSGTAAWPPPPRAAWRGGRVVEVRPPSAQASGRSGRRPPPPYRATVRAHHQHHRGREEHRPAAAARSPPAALAIESTAAPAPVARPPSLLDPPLPRPHHRLGHRGGRDHRPSPAITNPSLAAERPLARGEEGEAEHRHPVEGGAAQLTPGRKYRRTPSAPARRAPTGPGRPGPRSRPWCRSPRRRTTRGP